MFEMIQAITEDPIPALPPHLFSPELCDFVELMLRRDPTERPKAAKLLQHPFLQLHQGCDGDLVDMVRVSPATRPEVRPEWNWRVFVEDSRPVRISYKCLCTNVDMHHRMCFLLLCG